MTNTGSDHDHGESDVFALSFENLRFAVELMFYFTGKGDQGQSSVSIPDHHILRESPLVRLYRETGALLVEPSFNPSCKTSEALAQLFGQMDEPGLKVAEYDSWGFEALKIFYGRLLELSPEERRIRLSTAK